MADEAWRSLRKQLHRQGAFDYGFALTAREPLPEGRHGSHLGIITPSGESMPLTTRLASPLIYYLCWIDGIVAVSFRAGEATRVGKGPDLPLEELDAEFAAGPTVPRSEAEAIRIPSVVRPANVERPLICLLQHAPQGWPS